MAALGAKGLDVRAGGLRHSQPVERQERVQRMLTRRPEPGGHQQGTELVTVQPRGMGLQPAAQSFARTAGDLPRAGGAVDPRRPGLGVRLVPGTHPADSVIATGREQAGRRAAFVSQNTRR
jgi:hypothetical protein